MPDPLWNRIRLLEGRQLHVLSRRSPFVITNVDGIGAEGYPVKTGKRLLIRRNFLEPMWEDLRREGRLVIADWKATTTLPSGAGRQPTRRQCWPSLRKWRSKARGGRWRWCWDCSARCHWIRYPVTARQEQSSHPYAPTLRLCR